MSYPSPKISKKSNKDSNVTIFVFTYIFGIITVMLFFIVHLCNNIKDETTPKVVYIKEPLHM